MNVLKNALKVNAFFSLFTGLLMVIFHQNIAGIFGVDQSTIFWIIGILLLLFVFLIFFELNKLRPMVIKLIIVLDFIWVLGSLIVLVFNPFGISLSGNVLIFCIALIVLLLGVFQLRGLSNLHN